MKVLVSGAGGLVGSALTPALRAAGHAPSALVRRSAREGEVSWDPGAGRLDPAALAGFDAVVHLAGEGISSARWNGAVKARIRDSRVQGTDLLARTLAGLERPPQALVCASAVGYYGDRGEEALTEASAPGEGFLSGVCRDWEAACAPAARKGIRVVNLRFGVILSARGGALAKMLLPFKLGVGGKLGSGRQYMPWLTLEDAVAIVLHALSQRGLSGAVNAVAPGTATNGEFTRALGAALKRPAILPMPAFAARLAFGEMADALLLSSARVLPEKLKASGYGFRHPTLSEGLKAVLS